MGQGCGPVHLSSDICIYCRTEHRKMNAPAGIIYTARRLDLQYNWASAAYKGLWGFPCAGAGTRKARHQGGDYRTRMPGLVWIKGFFRYARQHQAAISSP
ncbi:MAG TPA: hypothetical protein DCZ91_15340 [Lachnospiraceae bacterium]|nr:hypothetical protein [Lachnospiraceae bacterium]